MSSAYNSTEIFDGLEKAQQILDQIISEQCHLYQINFRTVSFIFHMPTLIFA